MKYEVENVWDSDKLFPISSEGEWMGQFHIYVDESGKSQMPQTEFTALCGYVGHIGEFQRFSNDWTNCRLKWHVPSVHMARIMNPDRGKADFWTKRKSDLGQQWGAWRDAMLQEFGSIVSNAAIACVGIIIDAVGFRRAHADPEALLDSKDSNVFSFHHIIMRGLERIEIVDRHSPVSIVLDDDPQNVKAYYNLLQGLRDIKEPAFDRVRERIQAISFCKDDYYPGLQAADMVAYESRHFARRLANDSTAVPSDLLQHLTHGGINSPHYFDGEGIHELGRNIKRAIEEGKHDGTAEV